MVEVSVAVGEEYTYYEFSLKKTVEIIIREWSDVWLHVTVHLSLQ